MMTPQPIGGAEYQCYGSALANLHEMAPEELYGLLKKIRNNFRKSDSCKWSVPDVAVIAYINRGFSRKGEDCYMSPRLLVMKFGAMLCRMAKHPGMKWAEAIDYGQGHRHQAVRSAAMRLPDDGPVFTTPL